MITSGEKIKSVGIKATKPRVSIFEAFHSHCEPMSAEMIYRDLSKAGYRIDLATVYRTLTLFSNAGLLIQVNLRTDSQLYELAGHHHHHVVCTECGTTEHFDICIADSVTKKVLSQSKKFKDINDHALELFGVCNACKK